METQLTTPRLFDESIQLNKDLQIKLQKFLQILSRQPKGEDLKKTPDKKASYLPIDFVETNLDELFFGLWQTKNFNTTVLQNEIKGDIELLVFHPVAGMWLTRTGAASQAITVDALSDEVKKTMTQQERNAYALDVLNKKPNALQLGFPKLKTECIKNAALSLGNIFGRNINRTHIDFYTPLIKPNPAEIKAQISQGNTAFIDIQESLNNCKDLGELKDLFAQHPDKQADSNFLKIFQKRQSQLDATN